MIRCPRPTGEDYLPLCARPHGFARAFLPPLARLSPIRRAHGGATPHRLGPDAGPLGSALGIIPASAGCARRAHGQRGGA